jgi:cellulose biosynthesis protein BcsQ
MPRVFSFVGSRGGAGKTTAAILCAIEWLNRGYQVLFVDIADEQFHAAAVAVFVGRARSSPRMVSLLELLQRPKLARGFDIVIIDAPSGAPDLQKALLAITDVAIMPVGPSAYARENMLGDFAILTSARQSRPTLQAFVLLNRCRPQDRTTPVQVRGDAGAPTLSTRLSDFAGHQDLQGGQSARAKQERRRLVNELDSLE